VEINSVAAVIVGLFALLALILAHVRSLMRELARTVNAWHELQDALRHGNKRRDRRQDETRSSRPDRKDLDHDNA
jgi:hypothetical protein